MKHRHFLFPSKWKWRTESKLKLSENFKFPHPHPYSSSFLCLWTFSLLFLSTFVMQQSWAELVVNEAELIVERSASKKSSEEISHGSGSGAGVAHRSTVVDQNPEFENNRMVREPKLPGNNRRSFAAENMNVLVQRDEELGGDPHNVAQGPFTQDTCCITTGDTCQPLCVPDSEDERCGCTYKERNGYCQWRCQDLIGGDPNDIALDEDADPILDAVTDDPNSGGPKPTPPDDDDYGDGGNPPPTETPSMRIDLRSQRRDRFGFRGRGAGRGRGRSSIRTGGRGQSRSSSKRKHNDYEDILENPSQSSRAKSRGRSRSRNKKGRSFDRNRGIYSKGAVHGTPDQNPDPDSDPDLIPNPGPRRHSSNNVLSKSLKSSFRSDFRDLL